MGTVNCLITNILQNDLFMFNKRNKLIQVWNNMRVSKCFLHFWVNYPFKLAYLVAQDWKTMFMLIMWK